MNVFHNMPIYIHKCPFVCHHRKCRHSDREVPFELITPVTWACKKQQALALSSVEADYRVVVNASQEALWI